MTCPECGTAVYMSARYGLYEVERHVHHYCADLALPAPDVEQWDICACGERYVRINGGERLDMATRQPHRCPTIEPEKVPRVTESARPTLKEGNGTVPGRVPTIAPYHRVIDL